MRRNKCEGMTKPVPWISLSEASQKMGIAKPHNARLRLQRLEESSGERILRRNGSRWEVSPAALLRAQTDRTEQLGALEHRIARLERRIAARKR